MYQQGDIIYREGEAWTCIRSVDYSAEFYNAKVYGLLDSSRKPKELVGGEIFERDFITCLRPEEERDLIQMETMGYPVIGTAALDCCGYPYWNLQAIESNYPDLYKEIITKEYNKL